MSRHGGSVSRYKGKNSSSVGGQAREVLANIDETNPVIKMFLKYRNELDDKHDRYEKIVKLSRDTTIESKRIIFALHSTNTDIESKKQAVFDDAQKRFKLILEKTIKEIAVTLTGFDHYQYLKAYTNGIQEFTEAVLFYHYLKSNKIEPWRSVDDLFKFGTDEDEVKLLFPQNEFMLGLGDFTGELMRKCINILGVGNTNDCFTICNVVKDIHTGFLGIMSPGNKEIGRKAYVLKQSLAKMELVCYNIQIRGSEVPKHMLASVIEASTADNDDDEGFC